MKHIRQKRSSNVMGFSLTVIYFFAGMFVYLIYFFLRISSTTDWIEMFFLIYGLVGVLFVFPFILGMVGRKIINEEDECEYGELEFIEDECNKHKNIEDNKVITKQ